MSVMDLKYTELGKEVLAVFQKPDQQGMTCPIIDLIGDCEECPLGKVCDLVIEIKGSIQSKEDQP
ncbi:hypothetical protein KIAC18_000262 [Sporomusa sphaeroides]|uniref:hypothetical protein n=1 Tax=Sporomusa sphaeroides TaxID=47679 RepID=UPI003DA1356E